MDSEHQAQLYSSLATEQMMGGQPLAISNAAAANAFNSFAVLEHLQINLKHERERRIELEREVVNLRKINQEMERQLKLKEEQLCKSSGLHEVNFRAIKNQLQETVEMLSNGNNGEQNSTTTKGGRAAAAAAAARNNAVRSTRVEFIHHCDECSYETKSDVSIILHKLNHGIEQQYALSVNFFTTRNSNSKGIYNCPACDEGANLTRHEVYRHIYDHHTHERPLVCCHCELSFTHQDYLDEHQRQKHANKGQRIGNSKLLNRVESDAAASAAATDALLKSSSNIQLNQVNNNNVSNNGANSGTVTTTNSATPMFSSTRGRPPSYSLVKGNPKNADFKCHFADCNFSTSFPDKLEFHIKAHTNTKYKCPYCPYVSNAIVDIKRHIQKSKKHEGMKMYSCQKCSFTADCERGFKEHLRVYHFGFDVSDDIIDYFIEEMFSNKNKRGQDGSSPPGGGGIVLPDGPSPAALAAAAAAASVTANQNESQSSMPPLKKLATGSNSSSSNSSGAGGGAGVNSNQNHVGSSLHQSNSTSSTGNKQLLVNSQQQRSAASLLNSMLEEQQQQQQQHHQQQQQASNLSTSVYLRAAAASNLPNALSAATALANSPNLLMYHGLTGGEAGGLGLGSQQQHSSSQHSGVGQQQSSQPQPQSQFHPHHSQLSQLSSLVDHHSSSVAAAVAASRSQQQVDQQSASGLINPDNFPGQQQQQPGNSTGGGGSSGPNNPGQYVSYVNY